MEKEEKMRLNREKYNSRDSSVEMNKYIDIDPTVPCSRLIKQGCRRTL